MDILELYKCICVAVGQGGGNVSTERILYISGLNRTTFYRYVNRLIAHGYVVRPYRGLYSPVDIYQMEMWEGEYYE